ncbi:hypothetical protein B296_00041615 [Ensete ventricosum]|uniref:Uncharacterized protein n=1 Tax=Ensete ventricosum TaxID=4639 RepID=A0A426Z4Z2_ENSVE|nr:hypothetical protein B296_00041615 [Ensete ventricosum]
MHIGTYYVAWIAHSAYIDSPLGPDAFNEYESLLIQDYEELLKKSGKRGLNFHQEREAEACENDGWADLASGESYQSVEASSKGDIYADDSVNVTGKQESKKLLVSVHHFPMILCPLSPRVFVLPSEGTVAEACLSNDSDDSVSPGLPSISTGLPSDGEDVPPGATLTANFLYHLAAKRAPLDIRIPFGTIFSTDEHATNSTQLSEGIGAFVSGWNAGAIVNESADHADKIITSALDNGYNLLSGSFQSNCAGANYLETLLDRKAKDGAILIKKWLLETLQHENINVNLKGRPGPFSASEIHAMLKRLAQNQMSLIQNKGIIQLVLAAVLALSEPHNSHWDAFVNAEKILSIISLDTSQSLSSQIRDFINTSTSVRSNEQDRRVRPSQSLLSFQDALLLSMIGYILAGESFPTSASSGPFSWEEEHSLKEAIVDAVMENPSSAKLHFLHGLCNELEAKLNKEQKDSAKPPKVDALDDQWGSWDDEEADDQNEQAYDDMQLKLELRDRVDQLFKFFNKLSSLKRRNVTLREGLVASSKYGSDADTRKGLLYKLLTTLLAKYDVPGLEYHSSAVGRFLKSGFGRFGLGQVDLLLTLFEVLPIILAALTFTIIFSG